jgi:biopolymer transport protein ExbD
VTKTYDSGEFNFKKTLFDFEGFLIMNKYLKDKSGESYIAVYEKITVEGDVNIELGDFNDKGLLKQSPTAFYDCYRTRIPEVLRSNSQLRKIYEYFQNSSIESTTPGEASQHLLKVLKPDDFNHEVVKINSLYTFLLTANSTSDQSTTDDTEIARKKMFKREMTILLDNESNLYVNGNLIDSTGFSNLLKEFITPSRDTLKSVILQTSKKTWYKDFSKTLELIKKQFQMSRDKLSMELYQQLFGELAEDKKKKIRNQIPIDIQVDDSK